CAKGRRLKRHWVRCLTTVSLNWRQRVSSRQSIYRRASSNGWPHLVSPSTSCSEIWPILSGALRNGYSGRVIQINDCFAISDTVNRGSKIIAIQRGGIANKVRHID